MPIYRLQKVLSPIFVFTNMSATCAGKNFYRRQKRTNLSIGFDADKVGQSEQLITRVISNDSQSFHGFIFELQS